MQKYNLQNGQNPSRYYYNTITNFQFQLKPKISSFKNPQIKINRPIILPRCQNPLSYYILYNESKHNKYPCLG